MNINEYNKKIQKSVSYTAQHIRTQHITYQGDNAASPPFTCFECGGTCDSCRSS